jgi:hypothetical protein
MLCILLFDVTNDMYVLCCWRPKHEQRSTEPQREDQEQNAVSREQEAGRIQEGVER